MKRHLIPILLALNILFPIILEAQILSITPPGGRYATPFSVSIQAPEGYSVHFTLNGNTPTITDPTYLSPLPLSELLYSPSQIFRIQNCPDILWTEHDEIEHIIVLRAALFDTFGSRCSDVQTEVYLINTLFDRDINIPIVSLCVDSADLFDFDSGIFVPGAHFDSTNIYFSGNYCEHGREWERSANFIYLPDNTPVINQSCGIRIHGTRTRSYQQKGVTLYAREEYGNKKFRFQFFGNQGPDSYKRLVLRPWSAGWNDTGIPDLLCQRLAATLQCDHLLTQPVALFLNGEYWGIYFLQEKPDEHYIEEHFDIDDEDVNLLNNWGLEVENGTDSRWQSFYEWLKTADLSRDIDYLYTTQQIDINAFIDYMLLQVFVSNIDWPANNVRFWSANGSPWRWIFFDGDAAFAPWNFNNVILNQLTCDDPMQNYPSSPFATLLFRRLLANNDFKLQSIDRFYKIIYTHIGEQHSIPILQEIVEQLSDEVVHQSERFGNPKSLNSWMDYTNDIERYLRERSISMPDDYARHLGIDPNNISITLFPNPSHGSATLLVNSTYGGILNVEIYNSIGQRIIQHSYSLSIGLNPIPIPPLPHGSYFIRTSKSTKPFHLVVQ